MEQKELKIEIPEGYEIDQEKSTFEKIVFKKKEIEVETYNDVAKKLFMSDGGRYGYYYTNSGEIYHTYNGLNCNYSTNASTKEQLEWLMALNKLQNVANYLNGDWKPDWSNLEQEKYSLYFDGQKIAGVHSNYVIRSAVYFKNRELAEKAIKILGKEEVKRALGVYKGC